MKDCTAIKDCYEDLGYLLRNLEKKCFNCIHYADSFQNENKCSNCFHFCNYEWNKDYDPHFDLIENKLDALQSKVKDYKDNYAK